MPHKTRTPLEFLVLGHSPEGATGWRHPATLSVHPHGKKTLLNVSMGPSIVNAGGQLAVTRVILDGALDEAFAEEFDVCEARWLVPCLARLTAGQDLSADELIEAYQSRFGRSPRIERSAEFTV